jgi:glucose-6-phosphate-specific signal transduction histidine kinase
MWTTLGLGLVSLCLIGIGDYLTGIEIDFTLFYLIPVFVLTWTISRRAGILTAMLCALVWAVVDHFGRPELQVVRALWNIAIQFGVFVTFAYALSRIQEGMIEQRRLNTELQAALAEVKKLSGLLPICAWCRRIREGDGAWVQLESYIVSHSEADFTHSICPECAERVKRGN